MGQQNPQTFPPPASLGFAGPQNTVTQQAQALPQFQGPEFLPLDAYLSFGPQVTSPNNNPTSGTRLRGGGAGLANPDAEERYRRMSELQRYG